MRHLIAISIGPVQEFIAAARKTRDLQHGSEMLSDVSRQIATVLKDALNAELIFPHPDAVESGAAIANKILAILPAEHDPAIIAQELRRSASAWLVGRYEQALEVLGNDAQAIDNQIASRQVKHFLEFYCAWVPYKEADYIKQRKRVDRLLAGRKALRDFGKADARAGVPKSALDPSRESILPPAYGQTPSLQGKLALKKENPEPLDAVSLIKRVKRGDGSTSRFPSTVRVAADPYIRYLEHTCDEKLNKLNEHARVAWNNHDIEKLDPAGLHTKPYAAFPYDSQILYSDDPDIEGEIKSKIHSLVGRGPSPYFATLQADGDRMGQLLDEMTSPAEHRAFSKRLAHFATRAGDIVREHHGVLVYGGGDDVLAFLPVDKVVDCADRLRHEFEHTIAGGKLSVGISVCHYHDPLWLALDRARAAEKAAKVPRNALAVIWHTRSGTTDEDPAVLRWDEDPAKSWNQWISRLRDDALPRGVAYELRELAREFGATGNEKLTDALQAEVIRVLKRKRTNRGRRGMDDQVIQEIASQCTDINALEQTVPQLIIARRFASVTAPVNESKESK